MPVDLKVPISIQLKILQLKNNTDITLLNERPIDGKILLNNTNIELDCNHTFVYKAKVSVCDEESVTKNGSLTTEGEACVLITD